MYRDGHYGTDDEADSLLLKYVMEQRVRNGSASGGKRKNQLAVRNSTTSDCPVSINWRTC